MRIAIMIWGHMRTYKENYEKLQKDLKDAKKTIKELNSKIK